MKLSNTNCSRGAPMGRHEQHAYGCEGIVFELEWVPFIDGDYDAGGAYWGSPANIYCAVGTLDGEEVATHFLRNINRESAARALFDDYPGCTLQPENGSLVKQTIEFLETCGARETDEEMTADVEMEISDLQELLEEKGLA